MPLYVIDHWPVTQARFSSVFAHTLMHVYARVHVHTHTHPSLDDPTNTL